MAKRDADHEGGCKPSGKDHNPPASMRPNSKDQFNLTDVQSWIMKMAGGSDQYYRLLDCRCRVVAGVQGILANYPSRSAT